MRRFATIALSLSLVLGLTATNRMFAQDAEKQEASTPEVKPAEAPKEDVKKDDAPKDEAKPEAPKDEPKPDAPKEEPKPEAPKDEPKPDAPKEEPKPEAPKDAPKPEAPKEEPKPEAPKDAPKPEAPKEEPKKPEAPKEEPKKPEAPKEEPKKPEAPKDAAPEVKKDEASAATLAPIPPEVEAKLEAARRAVAEAIVAAQDAGLVQTSIDPPPILDILITGRATDEKAIQERTGVSPEVFGAWFTNYGKATEGISATKDVRIIPPSKGLQSFFDQRAAILTKHIKAVRDAKGGEKPAAEAAKPEEPKPAAEPAKTEETKKEETKTEEPKK